MINIAKKESENESMPVKKNPMKEVLPIEAH
jgi:hypothetical protein